MRPDRAARIDAFLAANGWQNATRREIAGDASSRRYERLTGGAGPGRAVLMDAPGGAQFTRFAEVARHLQSRGLAAPAIYAQDTDAGLMLLEDFGDTRYPKLLAADPGAEQDLFVAATEALVTLHRAPLLPGPDLGPETLTDQAGLAYETYLPATAGEDGARAKPQMQALLADAFAALPPWTPVLALRDYHAGNLFWLPDREGLARVGLIDFQDAGIGHPLYDLVSLARDARRQVSPATVAAMRARYGDTHEVDDMAWALIAVQRNLRILGIFARLALRDGKPGYLDHLPRTWALMLEDLQHPSLSRLKSRLLADLPPPTPDLVATLRDRCAHPTQ